MITELLLQSIEKQFKSAMTFDVKRCLRSRYNKAECDLCLSVCNQNALILDGRKISFSSEKCSDCLACVSVCPNDAFACSFDLAAVLSTLQDNKQSSPIVLTCKESGRHANQLLIPCIGLLSEPVLAAMHSVSDRHFFLDVHHCAGCENHATLDILQKNIQRISAKMKDRTSLNIQLLTAKNHPPSDLNAERRALLRQTTTSLFEMGKEASTRLFSPCDTKTDIEEKGKHASRTSRLLQEALKISRHKMIEGKNLLYSYHYTVTTNSNCDCCPACTGMCPSGALNRLLVQGKKQLLFTSAHCSGCGLCVSFCQKKALSLNSGAHHDGHVVLATT